MFRVKGKKVKTLPQLHSLGVPKHRYKHTCEHTHPLCNGAFWAGWSLLPPGVRPTALQSLKGNCSPSRAKSVDLWPIPIVNQLLISNSWEWLNCGLYSPSLGWLTLAPLHVLSTLLMPTDLINPLLTSPPHVSFLIHSSLCHSSHRVWEQTVAYESSCRLYPSIHQTNMANKH